MPPIPFDLETHLHRHGDSLRQLARELLRDRAAVDDALQETWLRALQSPPRHEAQVGGWLATILRHVVGRSQRGERRRQRREDAVSREPQARDHAELLARTEIAARLVAAVRALEPPYREVVWMRYFDGLPPREIAARERLPLLTVKSRLQRGLQQLRERLGEGGESSDWRGALALAFGFEFEKGTAAVGTVAAWQGGLWMAAWTKVVGVAAVLGVVAAWWWWPRDLAQPVGARDTLSTVAFESAAATRDPSVVRELTEPAADPDADTAPGAEAVLVRVRGRVVDAESNEALSDVRIYHGSLKELRPTGSKESIVTGADGRFEVECDAARLPRLWFTHGEHVPIRLDVAELSAGQTERIGDLPLERGRRLSGRVVDQRGNPLLGPAVVRAGWSVPPSRRWSSSFSTSARIQGDGSFVLDDPVRLGEVGFDVDSLDYELAEVYREVVTQDAPSEVVLVLRERPRITGIVVDASGQPLSGIGLSCMPGIVDTRSTDEGTFCLVKRYRNDLTGTQVHVVDAPDFAPPPEIDVAWGTSGLRIVLQAAGTLPLEVVDTDGRPVTAFGVVLWRPGLDPGQEGTVRHRGVHDGGRMLVERVLPGQTRLRVLPVDATLVPSDVLPVASLAPLRVELVPRMPCTVEVQEGERPVVGARVELVRDGGRYAQWYAERRVLRMPEPRIDLASAERVGDVECIGGGTTSAAGTLALVRDPRISGCSLLVQAVGRPVHIVFEPAFPSDGRPLRVDLTPYGRIAGRIDLRGRSRLDVQVACRSGERTNFARLQPDGTYCLLLPAGRWEVSLEFGEGATKHLLPGSAREVEVLRDTRVVADFDLANWMMARVSGAVSGALGDRQLVVDFVRVGDATPVVSVSAPVGAGGTFGPAELLPGTYRFALRDAEAATADVTGLAADTFPVAAGEGRWLDVAGPRRLVVNLLRPDGAVVHKEAVVARCGGLQFPSFTMLMRTVDERMVLDPAPALPVEFRNHAPTAPWSTPVVMPPDRTEAEVTVVLPDPPR